MPKTKLLIECLNVRHLLIITILWVFIFAILYCIVPEIDDESYLINKYTKAKTPDFFNGLYYSFCIATTLGAGEFTPIGKIKYLVIIEVSGGILLAGLFINAMIILPSARTKKALRTCQGFWIERSKFRQKTFYNFTYMVFDGDTLVKNGVNFDPGGEMHDKTYEGKVITSSFPMLLSLYHNDIHSSDYSEGILKFEMKLDPNGVYQHYEGSCYDAKGRRDQIVGYRLSKDFSRSDLEKMSNERKQQLIDQYFSEEGNFED